MSELPSSITLLFHDSENYRRLISLLNRSQKSHGEEFELTFGSSSVFLRRTSNPKEVTLYTHATWTNLLFGTMLLIDPKQVLLTGFQCPFITESYTLEFLRCIQECAMTSADCFIDLDDPEKFHQFRLRLRAFRSFLDISKKLGSNDVDELRRRTRLLSKTGNSLRDCDVRLDLYKTYDEQIPHDIADEIAILRDAALSELLNSGSALWFESLRVATQGQPLDRFIKRLNKSCFKEIETIETMLKKLDLFDDKEVHKLRIRMKKCSYALSVLKVNGKSVESQMKSIKAIQSKLGDIRDLRRFYILPGLDRETRYRAVQRLSSLEREVK